MNNIAINRRAALLAIPLLYSSGIGAQGNDWPNKPIRIVVPLPAGGAPDLIARVVGQALSPLLGQPVVVDNRPGATTTIGSEHVARSKPDGYTMLLTSIGAPALFPTIMTLRYDAVKDLPPLSTLARSEDVLITGAQQKMKTMQEFIERAKKNPGKASIGSIGVGTTNHLRCEMLNRAVGLQAIYVPYMGAPQVLQAVVSGDIDIGSIGVQTVLAQQGSGRIVPLAVASRTRSQFLPDVPTLEEAGIKGILSYNQYAAFLPEGVPTDIRAKLHAALVAALASQPVRDALLGAGMIPQSSTPEELSRLVAEETAALVPIAKDLKIQIN